MNIRRAMAVAATASALIIGVAPAAGATSAAHATIPAVSPHPADRGAVFVQTNDPTGNAVMVFVRGRDGRLVELHTYQTGGLGGAEPGSVVDPLASQGSLTYDPTHRLLYGVNAGSDTITVFAVHGLELRRVQVLSSGGHFPVSITQVGGLVYVLDAGGDGLISGFRVRGQRLVPIAGSRRSLGLGNPALPPFLASPSQVVLTPDGRDAIVATKTHATLVTFPLDGVGRPVGDPVVTDTGTGTVPFALTFDQADRLQVADATGGAYSYRVHSNGALQRISDFVGNGQVATCWSVSTRGFLYVANAGSATITGYRTGPTGSLSLLQPSGITATTGAGPVDLAASSDGHYLYQQATGAGQIDEFRIGADGSLTLIGSVAGLPVDDGSGPEGIAAS